MVEVLWQMTDVDDGGTLSFPEGTETECWSCDRVVDRRHPTREVAPADNENTRPPAEVNEIEVWRRDGTGCRTA